MAISLPSDMKVYDDLFNSGMTEVLQKNLEVFNQASNGAIKLIPRFIQGYNEKVAFYQKINGLVTRRDVTSTAAVTPLKMTQAENIHPKVFRKVGPVDNTEESWKILGRSFEEISFILGQQAAVDALEAFVETMMSAFVGVFKNTAVAATNVVTATGGTMVSTQINTALAKLGDKRKRVKIIVMHSKPFADLIQDQIVNYKFDMASGFALVEGSPRTGGLPVLVCDADSLYVPGATASITTDDFYYTLFLTEDAGAIIQSEANSTLWTPVDDQENIGWRFRSEFAYNVMVKGVSYTAGTVNPTNAAFATGANWTQTAASFKDLCGVALVTQ